MSMDDLVVLPVRTRVLVALAVALAVVVAAAVSVAAGPLVEQVVFETLLFLAAVLGYNLFSGATGYLSFGHGALYAAGGYAAILVALALGAGSQAVALIAGGLAAAALAVLVFGPLMRVRGPYFAVASLAVFVAAGAVASLIPGLGGSEGLAAPEGAGLGAGAALAAATLLVVAGVAASLLVASTRFGLRVLAVRDSEEAAQSLGLNPAVYRLAMLAVSGFIVGAAGATFFLSYGGRGYIDPELAFDPATNTGIVLAGIAGGLGSFTGVVIGALLVRLLESLLALYSGGIVALLGYNPAEAPLLVTIIPYLVLGVLVTSVALGAPRGIYGVIEEYWPVLARRLRRGG